MRSTTHFLRKCINLSIFLMISSGAIYLFYPDQHYNDSGWAVLIKYIIYIPLIVLIILGFLLLNKRLSPVGVVLVASWVMIAIFAYLAGTDVVRVGLYTLPVFAALSPQWVRDAAPKLSYWVLWLTVIGAGYEYFVLGGFPRFHPIQYRAISIFVNPNNLGIFSVILYYYARELGHPRSAISFVLSLSLILISGSKTGFFCFIILLFAYQANRTPAHALIALIGGGLVSTFAILSGLIPFESAFIRIEQVTDFFETVDAIFYPDPNSAYADSSYIQTWLQMGLIGTLFFSSVIIYCAVRDRLQRPLWLVLGAASITTNLLYLFPLAYVFWFYASDSNRPAKRDRSLSREA